MFDPVVEAFNKAFEQMADGFGRMAAAAGAAAVGSIRAVERLGAEVGRALGWVAKAYAEADAASKRTRDEGAPSS